jgi:hypothetical protein
MKIFPNRPSPMFLFIVVGVTISMGALRVFQADMFGIITRPVAFLFYVVLLLIFVVLCAVSLVLNGLEKHQRIQYWLIEQVRLSEKKRRPEELLEKGCEISVDWPWGSHSTVHLEHLRAAAEKFWVNYDPSDPSTAPTNEMVKTWLVDERAVSRDKAAAIASILRADSLPPGPRR